MEKFKKRFIDKNSFSKNDRGIKITSLISIIEENDYYEKLKEFLNLESYINDFIDIPGANTLVNAILATNKKFVKIDLVSDLTDISFYNEKDFTINFNNTSKTSYLINLRKSFIQTYPIYSASRDFFSYLFNMDKYANSLIEKGHKSVVNNNLELLKSITTNTRKYRILHELTENKFYLRAIVSTDNYFNYDNNLTIVIGLLTLYSEIKNSNKKYELKRCEYNESSIRMFFESSEIRELKEVGYVRSIVEISNDEIKREALRFSGVCTIEFQNAESKQDEIYIQPKEIKSKILSIKHNQIPKTAISELTKINNTENVHNELYKDIQEISNIKQPEQIKYIFKKKVKNATRNELKKFKQDILKILDQKADTILQLLNIFSKINLIADNDIEVNEYLRFLIYESLILRKK